jgi:multidrug resistance efflux pump
MTDTTSQRQQLWRTAATVAIVLIAIAAGWWLWNYYETEPSTRDGRVRFDVADVAPDVSGLVTKVEVVDNMRVHKGQPLFTIDTERFQLAVQQAEATLQQDRAALERADAAIAQASAGQQQAQAAVRAQQTILAEARLEDARNARLGDLVTTEALQQGRAKVAQLEAGVIQAQAAVSQSVAGIAQAKAARSQAEAALAQAEAALDTARLNLRRTTVLAPVDGVAANVQLRPGDYVSAGHPAFGVVDAASLHVEGYFEETKLRHIQVGDSATVQLMGGEASFRGHVESIAPGIADRERSPSGELLVNVNPTFNWVRLAQRIPVRIRLDEDPADIMMIAGRTASVSIRPGSSKAKGQARAAGPAATSETLK